MYHIFITQSKQIIRKKKKNKKADAYQFDTITILLISEKKIFIIFY